MGDGMNSLYVERGAICVRQLQKNNFSQISLAHTSGHPAWVHKQWPGGRTRHFAIINTTMDEYRRSCMQLYFSLMESSPGHPGATKIMDALPTRPSTNSRQQTARESCGSWIKIHYHPLLAGVFRRRFSELAMSLNFKSLDEERQRWLRFGISWKLGGQHLVQKF